MILSGNDDIRYINNDFIASIKSYVVNDKKKGKNVMMKLKNGEAVIFTMPEKEYMKMISKTSNEDVIDCEFIYR